MQAIRNWVLNKYAPDYGEVKQRNQELEYYAQFFPKFVDKQVVKYQRENELTTDGKERDICVMFTDVRGFTTFSQQVSLAAANSFLNNFYDIVVHHTQANGGIVDKFLGDGTMSIFGAMGRTKNYTQRCIVAAEAILKDFKDMTMQKDEPTLFLGVGISKGPAIVGTFGNGDFVNFTAIGHTVNMSARVQGCAKNNNIMATKEVVDYLPKERYESRGLFALKNVNKKTPLFEIFPN